ncbi:MAG TPA: diacylglycerol kinase family protein [Myxococcota bacterium]|nr:diacylglycerol kinase family protein [Myxococcota bacterium]
MKAPGVVVNARARRARKDRSLGERLARFVPDDYVSFTESLDDVSSALARFRELGTEHLLLVGGDGTVGGTLTPLLRAWGGAPLPTVTLTPGGTVNTIARSLEARHGAEQTLERMLDGAAPALDVTRPLVWVEPEDAPPRAGLIFVNGVAARWLEQYYEGDELGPRAAAQLVGRIARSALTGTRLARELFESRRVAIVVDGEHLDVERFTIMGASSVRDIGLGFRPFRSAGSYEDRIHFLYTDAGPARVCLELPAQRLGISGPGTCLRHFSPRTIELRFAAPEPWSVDADLYPPALALRVSAGPRLRFVSY